MKKKTILIILVIFLALALLTAAFFLLKGVLLKAIYPLEYEKEIAKYSDEYSFDPHFISAVIWTESGFKETAVSKKGAAGLMQIMPETGRWIAEKLGISDFDLKLLKKPDCNIRFGCWYLRYLEDKFGDDIKLVLSSYNAGPGRVQEWLKNDEFSKDGKKLDIIPFEETRDYVDKAKRAYEVYKELYKFD